MRSPSNLPVLWIVLLASASFGFGQCDEEPGGLPPCDGGVRGDGGPCVRPGASCDGGVFDSAGNCRSYACDGGPVGAWGECVVPGNSCDGGVWAVDSGTPYCGARPPRDAGADAAVVMDAAVETDAAVELDATVELDSGGEPLGAPVITAVAPTGTLGAQGARVTFSLTASGTPSAWSWNFGGGTTINVNAVEEPEVTLGAPGTYTGKVTATNPAGKSKAYPFEYTVTAAAGAPSVVSFYPPTGAVSGMGGQFSAIVNDSPTSYAWHFGGGATPNTSTEASPNVTFGAAGTYTVTLVATNASGSSEPYTTEYTVGTASSNPPVVNYVSQTGYLGATGANINFSAYGSDLADATWEWDFGTGATLNGSPAAYNSITLGAAGLHDGSVTATTGAGSSTFNFSFAVTATEIYAPIFDTYSVATSTLSTVAPRAILLADDRPLVAYAAASNHIAVSVSDSSAPTGSASFTVHEADATVSQPARALAAALAGSTPVLAYLYPDAGDLVLAVSTGAPAPTAGTDWTRHEVTRIAGAGSSTVADVEMTVVSGELVIAVLSDAGLSMAFAQSALPTSSASWAVHVLDASTTLRDCAVADRSGAVVGYIDAAGTQRFAAASVDPPTQASDWSVHEVETYAGANHLSMTIMGQAVVMSATGDTLYGQGHVLLALNSDPTMSSDWQSTEMGPEHGASAITTLDGRVALASMTSTTSAVAYAFRTLLPDIITADTWQYRQLSASVLNPLIGNAFGLSDGRFAFCYANAASTGSVVFAQASALW